MSIGLKLAIILMMAIGDGIAMVFVARKLTQEGRQELIPVIGAALVSGVVLMAVVLFWLF